jgi:ferritin heavy chain
MRGGRVVFQNIQKPNTDDWESALAAVEASLDLEKSVHDSILAIHKNADEHGDAQLTDFLEGEFLKEQVNLISEPYYLIRLKAILNLFKVWEL